MTISYYTYQDLNILRKRNASEQDIMTFVRNTINLYQSSDLFKKADTADKYAKQQNVEAVNREKFYRDALGQLTKNEFVPCHRIRSNIYKVLTNQRNQHLLGNGMTLENPYNKDKLGKMFDVELNKGGEYANEHGVAYLYWNNDHLEVFKALNFAPLYDETTSSLRAGVRWWRLAQNKPLRATLYEEDGYTEYIWGINEKGEIDENGRVLFEKRKYKQERVGTDAEGYQITDYQNYPSFPIVPLWANKEHICPLDGIKPTIDALDELSNNLNDDLVESQIFWLISGADGMDKQDLIEYMQQLRSLKVSNPSDGQNVQPYTVNIPYVERQSEMERLEKQIYRDFQALDISEIKSGAVTATQIKAAYEPLNHSADNFEYCVLEALYSLFKLIPGLENENPTFTRSMLINTTEQIQALELVKGTLGTEYVAEKELLLFGDGDKTAEILEKIKSEEMAMFMQNEPVAETEQQPKAEE